MARKKKAPRFQATKPPFAKKTNDKDEKREQDSEKKLARWRHRVTLAQKLRRDWENEYDVEKCEQYYLGHQVEAARKTKDLVFNLFRATIKTMRPNLFFQNPKMYVRPKGGLKPPAQELNSAIGEGVLEGIATQDDGLKNAVSLALTQAFFRVGVLKTVFDPKLLPNPRAGEFVYEEVDGQPVQDDNGNPKILMNPLTGEPVREPDQILTDQVYRYEYVDAKHLLLPDAGADTSKWPWLGEEVTVLLDEAKDDARFPKDLRDVLTANVSTSGKDTTAASKKSDLEADERFKYYEIYDLCENRRLIWADGQVFDEFLVDEPTPTGIEGHPYSILPLGDPILGPEPSPWPVPFTRSWLDPAREFNVMMKMIAEGSKRAARKWFYTDGTFAGPDEAAKMTSSDDMTGVKVGDPSQIPVFPQEPNLSLDLYKYVQLLMMIWRLITGQTGARLGNAQADTATEASFEERQANLRDVDTQDAVNSWLSTAGRKMFQLVKGTLTLDLWIAMRSFSDTELLRYLERVLQVPSEQLMALFEAVPGMKAMVQERLGKLQWRQITQQDLQFEADVTVVPGSARPRNLEQERRSFFEFLKVIGQFPQLAMSRELMKYTADKIEHMDDRVIDELVALAKKMIEVQANQAGRNQGGANSAPGNGQSATTGAPDLAALVAGMQGA